MLDKGVCRKVSKRFFLFVCFKWISEVLADNIHSCCAANVLQKLTETSFDFSVPNKNLKLNESKQSCPQSSNSQLIKTRAKKIARRKKHFFEQPKFGMPFNAVMAHWFIFVIFRSHSNQTFSSFKCKHLFANNEWIAKKELWMVLSGTKHIL